MHPELDAMEAYEAIILAAEGDGVGPSILLSPLAPLKGPQYLFNCPEGLARLAIEHKVRPSGQLAAVFLTSLLPQAAAGLPGLFLRLAVDGHEKLEVCGPPGTARYVHAQRHIVHWVHPRVTVSQAAAKTSSEPIFQDGFLSAVPIFEGAARVKCPHCADEGFDSEDDPIGKRETVDLSSSEAEEKSSESLSTSCSGESDSEESEEEEKPKTDRRGSLLESEGQKVSPGEAPTGQTGLKEYARGDSSVKGEESAPNLQTITRLERERVERTAGPERFEGQAHRSADQSKSDQQLVDFTDSEDNPWSKPAVSGSAGESAGPVSGRAVKTIDLSELSSVSSGNESDSEASEGAESLEEEKKDATKESNSSGCPPRPSKPGEGRPNVFAQLDSIFSGGKLGLRAMRQKALSTLTAGSPVKGLQAIGDKEESKGKRKEGKRREGNRKRPKLESARGKVDEARTMGALSNLRRGKKDGDNQEEVQSLTGREVEGESSLKCVEEIRRGERLQESKLAGPEVLEENRQVAKEDGNEEVSGSSSDESGGQHEASAEARNAPQKHSKQALFAQLDSIFNAQGSARETRNRALQHLGRPPGALPLPEARGAPWTRRGAEGRLGRGVAAQRSEAQGTESREKLAGAQLVVPGDRNIVPLNGMQIEVACEGVATKEAGPSEGLRLRGGAPKSCAMGGHGKRGTNSGSPQINGQQKRQQHKRFKFEQEGNSEESDTWKEEGAHWLLAARKQRVPAGVKREVPGGSPRSVPAGGKREVPSGSPRSVPAGNTPAPPKQRVHLNAHTPSSNPVSLRTSDGVLPFEEGLSAPIRKETGGALLGYLCFLGSPINGSILFMGCPSQEACQQLEKLQLPGCARARRGAHRLTAVFHFTPAEVAACQLYREWLGSFGDHVRHVMLSGESLELGYRATFRTLARLNLVDETIFPIVRNTNGSKKVGGQSDQQVGQQSKRDSESKELKDANGRRAETSQAKKNDQVVPGGLLARVLLRSGQPGVAEIDKSKCAVNVDVAEIQAQVLKEQPALVYWRAGGNLEDYEREREAAEQRRGEAPKGSDREEEKMHREVAAAGSEGEFVAERLKDCAGSRRVSEETENESSAAECSVGRTRSKLNLGGNEMRQKSGTLEEGHVSSSGITRSVTQAEWIYERQLAEQQAAMQVTWHSAEHKEQPTSKCAPPQQGASSANAERDRKTEALDSGESFPRIVFLGTGSAEPSKYRGGSAILLSFSSESALLMDCGEGAAGQLVRTSEGGARARALARAVRALWISHKHADHCLGALGVLQLRGEDAPELLIVGPVAVQRWLEEVGVALGENGHSLPPYTFRHCRELGSIVGRLNQLSERGLASSPGFSSDQIASLNPQPGFAVIPPFPSNLQQPNMTSSYLYNGQPVQSSANSAGYQLGYQQLDARTFQPAQFQSRQQSFQSNGQFAATNQLAQIQAVQSARWSGQQQAYHSPPSPYSPRGPYFQQPSSQFPSNQSRSPIRPPNFQAQPVCPPPSNQVPATRGDFSNACSSAIAALNLSKAQAVPVHHCADAWGLVIHHVDGWSLVYSGDTRPTRPLIEAGRGCTLLIHEATFEGKLVEHAKRKRHSTTEEALDVAAQMGAQRTILTHFSQRYPKAVEFESNLPSADTTCIAFDGMVVPFSELGRLPSLLEPMRLALADVETEDVS